MIIYRQNPPQLSRSDEVIRTQVLYSGFSEGLNNPDKESIPCVGPIPKGLWMILRWVAKHHDKGPIVGILVPVNHDAHGRSGFLIHGDNSTPAPNDASHGCIVTDLKTRQTLRDSGDIYLEVL